jgi:uncharacterized protein YegL
MVAENYTHLTLVIDRSGSMYNLASDVSGSINTLIREQAAIADSEITISLVQFDSEYEAVEEFVPAKHVNNYNLVPRGSTAMNDSVFRAINETKERIDAMPEANRPSNVIVTIATDGYENASSEVTNAQLKKLVEEREADGWSFVFIASNIDAKTAGGSLGITNTASNSHTGAGYAQTYSTLSATISTTRTTGTSFDSAWKENDTNSQ